MKKFDMKSTSNSPNEYSAISNENEEFTYEEFDHLMTKYNVPFTQTSFSRLDLSIFTSKLRELYENKNSLDDKAIIRKRWLLLIKNYLLIQRLNDILDHFLKVKSGGQLFLQKKYFHQWENKTLNLSNREKWNRIASLIRQINWSKKAHDHSSRLDKRRVDLAVKYLISRKEYQNPQYNFFIRKALPIITDKQKKILEEELEEDRQADKKNFQEVIMDDNNNAQNEKNNINDASGNSFDQNDEIFGRDIVLTPPQSPSDFSPNSTPKKRKRRFIIKSSESETENKSSSSMDSYQSKDIEIENQSSNISEKAQNVKPRNSSKNNSKLLIVFAFVYLTILAFAIGFGSSIAFFIHRSEYDSFDDYMNSNEKSKEFDQHINNININDDAQNNINDINQYIQINDVHNSINRNIQKQPSKLPNEENDQKIEMQQ